MSFREIWAQGGDGPNGQPNGRSTQTDLINDTSN